MPSGCAGAAAVEAADADAAATTGVLARVSIQPTATPTAIAAAWSAQVAGNATASTGSLDLVNFERRQARLLFGVNF